MNRLDKISHYLSYTDCLPILSIPSGIVHLICAIRDRALPKTPLFPPANETLYQLSKRKLNNWSHIQKGILAIIPIIGNAILLKKRAKTKLALKEISHYSCYSDFNKLKRIPTSLVNNKNFLIKLPSINKINTSDANKKITSCSSNDRLFSRTSIANKSNLALVENLINNDIITDYSYGDIDITIRKNPRIITAYESQVARFSTQTLSLLDYYKNLPDDLKINVSIINTLAKKLGHSPGMQTVLRILIPDKNIYKNVPVLMSTAIKDGEIPFKDLPPQQQTLEAALTALRKNLDQFNGFSKELQQDPKVVQAYKEKREQTFITKLHLYKILFKDLPDDLKTEASALVALNRNFNKQYPIWESFSDDLKLKLKGNIAFQQLQASLIKINPPDTGG